MTDNECMYNIATSYIWLLKDSVIQCDGGSAKLSKKKKKHSNHERISTYILYVPFLIAQLRTFLLANFYAKLPH